MTSNVMPFTIANFGGGDFKVTPDELKNASGLVQTDVNNMKNMFSEIERLSNSSSSFWNGDAADAFRNTYAGYKGEIETIIARISEHIVDLQTMAGVYEEAEKNIQEAAGDLPSDVII